MAVGNESLLLAAVVLGWVLTSTLIGALVGVVAGLRPAYRAARLNVLDAISAE